MPRLIGPGFLAALTAALLLALGSGQALASHVQCGDMVTQDMTLDSDLIDCPGSGLVIGADGITLDLGGHTIDGIPDRTGIGIDNDTGHQRVTVANGHVREFASGVRFIGAADSEVRRISFSENFYGVRLMDSDRNVVTGNFATADNPSIGISLTQSDSNEIRGNVLVEIDGGIELSGSSDNRVEDNRLSRIDHTGLFVSGPAGNIASRDLFRHNIVTEYGIYGIYVGGVDHRVEGNTITGRGTIPHVPTYGIYAGSADGVRIEGNSVARTERGIFCIGSAGTTVIAGNRLRDTRQAIVSQSCESSRIAGNSTTDVGASIIVVLSSHVSVVRNLLRRTQGGIVFFEAVSDSTIAHNVIRDSIDAGIDASGSRNRIVGNVVIDSRSLGILLWGDNNDVVDNLIRGSGRTGVNVSGREQRVAGNRVIGSGESGIYIRATGARIVRNLVRDSEGDGLFVYEGGTGAVVGDNRVYRNADDGIDVDEPLTTLSGNRANRNGDLGVEAVSGVTDAGGNSAFANGDPLQCLNIACRRK